MARRARVMLLARAKPRSSRRPRIWLTTAVRWLTILCLARCSAWTSCCSTDLFGTEGTCGWRAAVQIASASLPSFFCRRTNGFTYCGLMIFTCCPRSSNSRAQ